MRVKKHRIARELEGKRLRIGAPPGGSMKRINNTIECFNRHNELVGTWQFAKDNAPLAN